MSLRLQPGNIEVNAARTFVLPVVIEAVRGDALAGDILGFAIVHRDAFLRADYFQHVSIFSAALAAECVTPLGGGRDQEFDKHVVTALLPPDDIALGKDARACYRKFGTRRAPEVRAAEVRAAEVR